MGQLFGWLALSCLLCGINAEDLVQCDSEKTAEYCEECPGDWINTGCGGAGSDCFYYEPWDLCLNNEEKEYLVPGGENYVYDYEGEDEGEGDDYSDYESSEVAEVEDEEEMIDGDDAHEIVKRRARRRRPSKPKGWKSPLKMPKRKQNKVRVKYNKPKSRKRVNNLFRGRTKKRKNSRKPQRFQKKKKNNSPAYKPKVGKSRMVGRPKFNLRDYYLRLKARGGLPERHR